MRWHGREQSDRCHGVQYLCQRWWGYDGALAGAGAQVPALIIIPRFAMLLRRRHFLSELKPAQDRAIASHPGKFTLMALMTAVTLLGGVVS